MITDAVAIQAELAVAEQRAAELRNAAENAKLHRRRELQGLLHQLRSKLVMLPHPSKIIQRDPNDDPRVLELCGRWNAALAELREFGRRCWTAGDRSSPDYYARRDAEQEKLRAEERSARQEYSTAVETLCNQYFAEAEQRRVEVTAAHKELEAKIADIEEELLRIGD